MTARCKEGHDSTELDYCSVCGSPMGGVAPGAVGGGGVAPSEGGCPSCGEPRTDAGARFCEVCRYDFVSRKAGPPPAAAPSGPAPAPPPAAQAPAPAAPRAASSGWEIVVRVDPSLDTEPDPATPCPKDEPEHVFSLDLAETLVGRRDDQRDIRPEVPVSDPGTSRRHAKFVKNADGTISLLDLASMNGSRLNGAEIPAGSRHVLRDGDAVIIGRWTRIVLRGKP